MSLSSKYEAIKVFNGKSNHIIDSIVVEAPLQININHAPYTVAMRTPGDDNELIRGLLYAEDIYKGDKNFNTKIVENTANSFTIINVSIPESDLGKGYLNKRTLLSVSSCGICGKQDLESIKVSGVTLNSETKFEVSKVSEMFDLMMHQQYLFKKTGASHAAAIFDTDYSLLTIKEDIGRHNAVDKVIGDLINTRKLKSSKYILVSGRVSYEIVTKAFIAKIPTILAVSGCSSLAIDFAKEFGIKLIGFTRGKTLTVYN